MNISQFLGKLGIRNHPGLRYKRKLEGYRDYTFGCRAGPCAPNISDLAHELAHAAQFGPETFKTRALESGFRFKVPKKWVYDRYVHEATTCQATIRELETFAYQAHLMEAAGIQLDKNEFFNRGARLMVRFMHDWYIIPGENTDEQHTWCIHAIERFYENLTPEMALSRLNAWLDRTAERLNRPHAKSA